MRYNYSQSGKDSIHGGAVSVTRCSLIALEAPVQQRNVHGLRALVVACAVPYVPPQRVFCCQHVVFPKGGRTPPAGAICIPDRTIHHPHCSTQFKLLLQTASGNRDSLYMDVSVMRALETCPVALGVSLKG